MTLRGSSKRYCSHYSYLIHVVAIIKSLLADYHEHYNTNHKSRTLKLKSSEMASASPTFDIEQHGVLFSIEDAVQVPGLRH